MTCECLKTAIFSSDLNFKVLELAVTALYVSVIQMLLRKPPNEQQLKHFTFVFLFLNVPGYKAIIMLKLEIMPCKKSMEQLLRLHTSLTAFGWQPRRLRHGPFGPACRKGRPSTENEFWLFLALFGSFWLFLALFGQFFSPIFFLSQIVISPYSNIF